MSGHDHKAGNCFKHLLDLLKGGHEWQKAFCMRLHVSQAVFSDKPDTKVLNVVLAFWGDGFFFD